MLKEDGIFFSGEHEIRSLLCEKAKDIKITLVKETGSTNDDLKKAAQNGEKQISLLIAEKQTKGKGRKGRSFFSPEGTGCYMSFLLRPDCNAAEATLLTTTAAAATAVAIEKVTGIPTGIKWVNDIFIGGRKVAGILTEGAVAADKKSLEWAVVGIGINLTPPQKGFPDEIATVAGAVSNKADKNLKSRIIAEITNTFLDYYSRLTEKAYFTEYRRRLFFLGNEVTVIDSRGTYTARAVDIDPMCHLIVELPDKSVKTLFSGEISIKL